jgi:hypothetical protein
MTPVSGVDGLRSTVPDGGKFPVGRWRRVGLWVQIHEPLTIFGGEEGYRLVPRVELREV